MPGDELARLYREGDALTWHSDPRSREDWATAKQWLEQNTEDDIRILDIGCSTGQFLADVLGLGFEKYGIEVNAAAAQIAEQRGIRVLGPDICSISSGAAQLRFSSVVAFDVIEHIEDPLDFLRQCVELLPPGGRIIISTGNTAARSWRLSGARYWYCAIPEHISFINEQWCHYAADQLGLALTQVHFFAHAKGRFFWRARELVFNTINIVAPPFFRTLRRAGLGGKDIRRHPELVDYPPIWMTAKDHFMVELKKF